MPLICILLPDSSDMHAYWRPRLDAYAALLGGSGMEISARPWDEPAGLAPFDLVLPLLAWGYHLRPDKWFAQLRRWEEADTRLENAPSALRWNSCKTYLAALGARGVPIVPTHFVERLDRGAVETAARCFGSDRLIVKPQISGSSYQTLRVTAGDDLKEGPEGAAMIQPYLESIEIAGETSLFYFGGRFGHAIRKVAAAGDFRAQPEHGADIRACFPPADELDVAARALRATGQDLLYARIDIVRDAAGKPRLLELEAIEPDLYLDHALDGGALFASTVASRLRAAARDGAKA